MTDTHSEPITVVFALFPGVTQLDFTGPHQILGMAPDTRLILASIEGGELATDSGLRFGGVLRLEEIERCDVLCVPGGYGTSAAMEDEAFLLQLRRLAEGARYVTSVCTGSLLLGAAGLLNGRRAACHWAWREVLSEFGATPDPARVCRDGNVLTGGGVTAGIDFALTLVAEIAGETTAQSIQLMAEYAPSPPFDAGRPETAPPEVLAFVRERGERAGIVRRAAVASAAARLREIA
jgi:cyclohexyl-isocyanide hydratase